MLKIKYSNRNKLYVKHVIKIASVARFIPILRTLKPCIAPSINPKTCSTLERTFDLLYTTTFVA